MFTGKQNEAASDFIKRDCVYVTASGIVDEIDRECMFRRV